MSPALENNLIRLALPKGRMQEGVSQLLADAGVKVSFGSRAYRPSLSYQGYEVKLLKPQNIIEMLALGSRDLGFAGLDWVRELEADLVELLDCELDPVRLVAAAPPQILVDGQLPMQPLVIASEYERLTKAWILRKNLNATCISSYGATEVFPPEDADCIVDNTASGSTLAANNLVIFDELLVSSTRLFANPRTLDNPLKRDRIEDFVLLLKSVIDARSRVMLEVNISAEKLDALVRNLPSMRKPTISPLQSEAAFAVKAAVPRRDLPRLIPLLKACGGTDIAVSKLYQLVA